MQKTIMLKAILAVFSSYGIALTGKRKHAHFYDQLGMDKVYVYGLVYELENLVGAAIEEDWGCIDTPWELICKLSESVADAEASGLPVADDKVPVVV
jgi:hypothetical protein